jgi:hypothetical protein
MTEQIIITQFGEQIGAPVTKAGLHWKVPFIQKVNRIEKRILEWDGPSADMPTEDKLYIDVDAFARWRITDAQKYFVRMRDERTAQNRITNILGSETRNAVARHQLVELIRTQRDRKPVADGGNDAAPGATLPAIQFGRAALEAEILAAAKPLLGEYGMEHGQFIYPTDIAFAPDGRMFIAEYGSNDRIQVFDRDRAFLYSFGSNGVEPGQFLRPQAIVYDAERDELYVADVGNHRIQVFTGAGELHRMFGSAGQEPGKFAYPFGLALEIDGKAVISATGRPAIAPTGPGKRTVVVAEHGNHRVQRLDAESGAALDAAGGLGTAGGRLKYPWALEPAGTTPDGALTIEPAECLGACDFAPCILANDDLLKNMTPEAAAAALKQPRAKAT